MNLQPGEVPTDESLEMEASQLDAELDKKTQAKFDKAKKDGQDFASLQKMNGQELIKIAEKEKIEEPANLSKQKLVFEILKARATKQGLMMGEGTLEILPDGFGFLRSPEYSYMASPDDVYVSPSQIRRFGLRRVRPSRGSSDHQRKPRPISRCCGWRRSTEDPRRNSTTSPPSRT